MKYLSVLHYALSTGATTLVPGLCFVSRGNMFIYFALFVTDKKIQLYKPGRRASRFLFI